MAKPETRPFAEEAEQSDELQALRREVRRLNREASSRRAGEATVLHAVRQLYKDPSDLKIPHKPAASRKKREEIALNLTEGETGYTLPEQRLCTGDIVHHEITHRVFASSGRSRSPGAGLRMSGGCL